MPRKPRAKITLTDVVTMPQAPATPAPAPSRGWIWDQLAQAKTPDEIRGVDAKAIELGYSAAGLFRQEVAKRLREG